MQVHNGHIVNKISTACVNGFEDNLWAICGAMAIGRDLYRMVNMACILMPGRPFDGCLFY